MRREAIVIGLIVGGNLIVSLLLALAFRDAVVVRLVGQLIFSVFYGYILWVKGARLI